MGKKQLKLGLKVKEFSYAYGGLHRWSPRGEKAELGLIVKENKRRRRKTEKGKNSEA